MSFNNNQKNVQPLKMTHTIDSLVLSLLLIKLQMSDPAGGRLLHEQATDDCGLRRADVGGSEQLGEAVAEVVHLPVQAPDIAARLLQHCSRRHRLHAQRDRDIISAFF
jgi:hypothetical protein